MLCIMGVAILFFYPVVQAIVVTAVSLVAQFVPKSQSWFYVALVVVPLLLHRRA